MNNTKSTCIKEECKTVIHTILDYYQRGLSKKEIAESLKDHYHESVIKTSINELEKEELAVKTLEGKLTSKYGKPHLSKELAKEKYSEDIELDTKLKNLLKKKIKENLTILKEQNDAYSEYIDDIAQSISEEMYKN